MWVGGSQLDTVNTVSARAIPVVIVYNAAFEEVGWWGPRPAALQRWFKTDGQLLEKGERDAVVLLEHRDDEVLRHDLGVTSS